MNFISSHPAFFLKKVSRFWISLVFCWFPDSRWLFVFLQVRFRLIVCRWLRSISVIMWRQLLTMSLVFLIVFILSIFCLITKFGWRQQKQSNLNDWVEFLFNCFQIKQWNKQVFDRCLHLAGIYVQNFKIYDCEQHLIFWLKTSFRSEHFKC